ncbi:MAG: nucleoside recognition domain-containing protein [Myxococcota bacterium]
MNRVFIALIAIAFVFAGGQQLAYESGVWDPAEHGWAPVPGDCDEKNPDTHPGAADPAGDGVDQDCDKSADAATPPPPDDDLRKWFEDKDHDGYGNAEKPWTQPMAKTSEMLFSSVKAAVLDVVLPLIGAMAFFLGVMKVAEKSGTMLAMAKLVRPLMVWLFPDVPPNHPAMSAMILNIAANAMGLGNAATPFGLKAMAELDKLNPAKGTATNAMALFLAINTSSVTLLATGVVGMRAALGSKDPAGIIPTTLMGTMFSTVAAVTACKLLERFSPQPAGTVSAEALAEKSAEQTDAYPLWVSVAFLLGLVAAVPLTVVYGEVFGMWIVPMIVVGFIGWGWVKGVLVYEAFIEGAREGFETGVRIIPYLVAILGVVGMLRGSGAIDVFTGWVGPATSLVNLPPETVPMVLLRPLSGSGASGVMMSVMKDYGVDSYSGYLVSTLQGSSETTFYVLAVYFGSVGIKNIRHAMIPGLIADLFGAIGAVVACTMYFHYNGLPMP